MKRIITLVMILAAAALVSGCDDDKVVFVDGEPSVPVGVYSVTHDGFIEIVWQANNDAGLTEGYGVYRFIGYVGELEEYELIAVVTATLGEELVAYNDHDVVNGNTYYYAVNAYNEFGESELSYADIFDTPRPQGSATLRSLHEYPNQAGYDFSRFRAVHWEDPQADIFFEYDSNLGSFFVWVGGENYDLVDIQDYGYTYDITDVNWGDPGGGWSTVGWLELAVNHAYIVWTADNHFAAFRVNGLDVASRSINITWSYQTDPGNPELKRRVLERPQHAENYGRREG